MSINFDSSKTRVPSMVRGGKLILQHYLKMPSCNKFLSDTIFPGSSFSKQDEISFWSLPFHLVQLFTAPLVLNTNGVHWKSILKWWQCHPVWKWLQYRFVQIIARLLRSQLIRLDPSGCHAHTTTDELQLENKFWVVSLNHSMKYTTWTAVTFSNYIFGDLHYTTKQKDWNQFVSQSFSV